ncbi:hypothetical protein PpBr36_04417 [Pyricularia pennisetigena]|uniref:hypothetical protein n=1 Tax=Pyricularia pennisetigena TaxID=1578925 RepID=UPI001153C49C|nr:hypothetical protein PpBr36_04417 [Pyricularia pennisetigena]TLS27526.1 hypothetical protein PpBr36_04417 [Pyricularia pennisetigena]
MAQPSNELFQYSIVSSLMDGVASSGMPVVDLLKHGDMGLGTFKHMVGEMIMLDGAMFQMKSDGTVVSISPSVEATTNDDGTQPMISPFATVTRFEPTAHDPSASFSSKESLAKKLSEMLPGTRNIFMAFRADGVFNLTVRTAGGQQCSREPLVTVASRQTTHTFENERGTIVGFRSPSFSHGISVAGDHIHFISDDRKRGGHVLALNTEEGSVRLGVAPISKVHLQLPVDDQEYNDAELKLDSEGINSVEG